MKVAVLTYDALPNTDNWGGTQRIHYLANHLSERYKVKIWSSCNTADKDYRGKHINYATTSYPNKLHIKFVGRSKKVNSSVKTTGLNKLKIGLRKLLKLGISKINKFLYNEPNPSLGLIGSVWTQITKRELFNSILEWNPDIVIISIPPWSIANIALIKRLKRVGIKILIDYRDPWNCWNGGNFITRNKERKLIRLSDLFFTATETHRQKLIETYNIPEDRIKTVRNGYDEELWDKVSQCHPERINSEKLVISYVGTIAFNKEKKNGFRNPFNLLMALSKFEHGSEIELRIIGYYDKEALNEAKKIFPNITMLGKVSQEESFHFMLDSHILMNLHTAKDESSKFLIAGKIYDYYRSGRKILSINNANSYEQLFIREKNLGYCAQDSVESILIALRNIYEDWTNSQKDIPSYSTELLYSRKSQNSIAEEFIISKLK